MHGVLYLKIVQVILGTNSTWTYYSQQTEELKNSGFTTSSGTNGSIISVNLRIGLGFRQNVWRIHFLVSEF